MNSFSVLIARDAVVIHGVVGIRPLGEYNGWLLLTENKKNYIFEDVHSDNGFYLEYFNDCFDEIPDYCTVLDYRVGTKEVSE